MGLSQVCLRIPAQIPTEDRLLLAAQYLRPIQPEILQCRIRIPYDTRCSSWRLEPEWGVESRDPFQDTLHSCVQHRKTNNGFVFRKTEPLAVYIDHIQQKSLLV